MVKKTWMGNPGRGRHGCLAVDWGKSEREAENGAGDEVGQGRRSQAGHHLEGPGEECDPTWLADGLAGKQSGKRNRRVKNDS